MDSIGSSQQLANSVKYVKLTNQYNKGAVGKKGGGSAAKKIEGLAQLNQSLLNLKGVQTLGERTAAMLQPVLTSSQNINSSSSIAAAASTSKKAQASGKVTTKITSAHVTRSSQKQTIQEAAARQKHDIISN